MTTARKQARRSRLARSGPIALLVGAIAACAGCETPSPRPWPTRAANQQGPGAARAEAPRPSAITQLTPRQRRQLGVFGPTLLNASDAIDAETRLRAAEELLAMGLPEAMSVLAQALRGGEAKVMMAVITALQSSPQPPPSLLEPAVDAVVDAPAETVDPLSIVLVAYGDDACRRVAKLALDQAAAPSARLGPIHALGSFRSRTAAVHLMGLLDERRGEPQAITDAASAALVRLTGLPYGNDAEAWTRWWQEAKDRPHAEWLVKMIERLSNQVADLKQHAHAQELATENMQQRLFDTYRELFPALTLEEQLRRLPDLLDDELVRVREFAVGRLDRLLRDSVRIPDELSQKLAERIDDKVPSLRLQAARLLDELNFEATSDRLADRLARETDATVAAGLIDILTKRPSAKALPPLCNWLTDPDLGAAAAGAVWALVRTETLSLEQRSQTRAAIDRALAWQPRSPELCRILAFIGDDNDRARLEPLLVDEDPALRAAVAEGFSHRGLRQPLLSRAADEMIYPFAVAVLAEGPADLDNFELLAGLRPPSARVREKWTKAIVKLADRLEPADLLRADDILAGIDYADIQLRHDVLARAENLGPEALGPDPRAELIARLAGHLIDRGDAARAYTLVMGVQGAPDSAPLRALAFRAAVLAGKYEEAEAIHADPDPWVQLLTELARQDTDAAVVLQAEIGQRFLGRLNGGVLARYDAASELLATGSRPDEQPD
ncbi:MAG: hypothetical protein ACYSXF_01200 [Planctomycetota bacterium]|jgi:hypothetical protein